MISTIFTIRIPSGQDLDFEIISKEDRTVRVIKAEDPVGDLVIPKSVAFDGKEYIVTAIREWAFCCCTNLTSVIIPDSVTSIGDCAFFDCSSLTSVIIPDSVTSIGSCAFSNCSSLTSVTIPDSVTSIGDFAFSDCVGLTSVNIPDSVTSIGRSAFDGCRGLTIVNIPNSVTYIERFAFSECHALTSITIPNSATSVEDYAFRECRSLTTVIIPDSVTFIGDCAFRGCRGLTSVTIPDSVTYIGKYAFDGCDGLIGRLTNLKKYYKGFYPGLVCRNYHFQEGVVNELKDKEKEISLCRYGFHFCDNLLSVFDHYLGEDGKNMELWEVEPMGKIIYGGSHNHCCEKLRLIRRIPFSEIGKIVAEAMKYSEKMEE